jgi:hypothetical protein
MKKNQYPDKKAFKRVCQELNGPGPKPLNLEMVGDVFGSAFWIMLVYCFMDAGEAARAIQGAVNKLREESKNTKDKSVN